MVLDSPWPLSFILITICTLGSHIYEKIYGFRNTDTLFLPSPELMKTKREASPGHDRLVRAQLRFASVLANSWCCTRSDLGTACTGGWRSNERRRGVERGYSFAEGKNNILRLSFSKHAKKEKKHLWRIIHNESLQTTADSFLLFFFSSCPCTGQEIPPRCGPINIILVLSLPLETRDWDDVHLCKNPEKPALPFS